MPKLLRACRGTRILLGSKLQVSGATFERIEKAQELLTQGHPMHTVVQKLANLYGVTYQSAKGYIQKAYKEWSANPPPEREQKRDRMRANMMQFYTEAMNHLEFASAGRILKELCHLDGLYPEQEAKDNRDNPDLGEQDPDRIRERMATLLTRHADKVKELTGKVHKPSTN